jgi:hypothetical protein
MYGARHRVFNNTVQVNGNGGSRPSATALYESPLTIDSGDAAPGTTSNGHANVVAIMVENNLLVKCGNPIMVVDNYGTAPQGTIRNNWVVECANTPADGVGLKGTSASKSNMAISGNTVHATVAAAGLVAGPGGHFVAPASANKGSRATYLTAAMVGRGSTFDPYSGTSPGTGGGGGTPTPTDPTPTDPGPTPPTGTVNYPADVLNLQPWKLNVPTLTNGSATEIKQPALSTYTSKFFFVNPEKTGVVFRVWHGGETTANSPNPRSELRERTANGSADILWNGASGRHKLTVVGMITRQTNVRPHNVLWQIHGGGDDVTVFRRENNTLYITNGDNTHAYKVTDNFPLNQRYTLVGEVIDGTCNYYLNGVKIPYTLKITDTSCYFKAGNYLQSNPTSAPGESTSAYSDVIIYSVTATHS